MRFDAKHRKNISKARKRLLASGYKSQNSKKPNIPDISNISDAFGHWLAGFVAGEGCFTIRRQGELFYPAFTIALRYDDEVILREIRNTLGFGKVRYYSTKTTHVVMFGVWAWVEALALVALFRRFPLRAKKQADFEAWARCVEYGNKTYQAKVADIQQDLDLMHSIKHPSLRPSKASKHRSFSNHKIISVAEIVLAVRRLNWRKGVNGELWKHKLRNGVEICVRCVRHSHYGNVYLVWEQWKTLTKKHHGKQVVATTAERASKKARALITKHGASLRVAKYIAEHGACQS